MKDVLMMLLGVVAFIITAAEDQDGSFGLLSLLSFGVLLALCWKYMFIDR